MGVLAGGPGCTSAPGRLSAPGIAAGAAIVAALLAGCGGAGPTTTRLLPGPGGRLDPIYDATVLFPDTNLVLGGLTYTGLEIDLAITFDDATLHDDDPSFAATAEVTRLLAGGQPQPFAVEGPLDLGGTLDGGVLDTGSFGPIRVGTSNLFPDLTGTLQDDRRRLDGTATLFGSADAGSCRLVKRRRYLVVGSDLLSTTGEVSVVTVRNDAEFAVADQLESTSSDPAARVSDGRPFVVNRYTYDNLQGLDPARGFATAFQDSVGHYANPHDVAAFPPGAAGDAPGATRAGLAFVTRYDAAFNDVGVFSLDDGSLVDRVDLTPYAQNPDHTPRPDQILLHDGLLYVTIEDVDRSYTRFANGHLVLIDPAGRSVVQVIDLAGQNPFESLTFSPATGLIWIGLAGIFPGLQPQALTGGIEAIDPAARRSLGLVVDDDLLGGNVTAVAVPRADRGYCVVSDATFHNRVVAFDPAGGAVLGTVVDSTDLLSALVEDGDGYVLVAVQSFVDPHILILDAATGSTVMSLPAALPPLTLAVLTRSL